MRTSLYLELILLILGMSLSGCKSDSVSLQPPKDRPAQMAWTILGTDLSTFFFLDKSHVWAVAMHGSIAFSSDGGRNWLKQKTTVDAYLLSVIFLDDKIGWAVGSPGLILGTIDGGASCNIQYQN